ncbi:nesprin-2-like isoform X2 [Sardina pilchardus]|uniref:nesprin-2-like isoform X2 n=1 Tax=Sardina pilchardus TaxID=27697 RepID=UPI002E0E0B77
MSTSQTQLQHRLDTHSQLQWRMSELHASIHTNLSDPQLPPNNLQDLQHHLQVVAERQQQHQQQEMLLATLRKEAEPEQLPSSLSQQAVQLEAVLESVWWSLQQSSAGVCVSVEQQRLLTRLLQGLRNLLALASQRLTHTPRLDTHTPAQLQEHINTQEKLFLSVSAHLRMLQHLSECMSASAPSGWEGEVQALEQEVHEAQQGALERRIHLHRILQIWTQWEHSRCWLESRLTQLEKQLPIMHLEEEEETEEELQERTSIYENLQAELQQCHAHSQVITEHAQRLHQEGGASDTVGGATRRLELRLAALQQKVNHGIHVGTTTRKILSRFRGESAELARWMGGAKERIDACRSHMTFDEQDPGHALLLLQQYQEFSRELELHSALKASVLSAGTQLTTLRERQYTHTSDHTHTHTHTATAEDTHTQCNGDKSADEDSACLTHTPHTHTHTHSEAGAALSGLQEQLDQLEQNWTELLSEMPALQENVQQVLLEDVAPQGLLVELRAQLEESELSLQQHSSGLLSSPRTSSHLTPLLHSLKALQACVCVQQFSVELLNQAVLHMDCSDTHFRYTHTQFAEELGDLNNRWALLKTTLNSQVQQVEQVLGECSEREAKLHVLLRWVKGQQDWLRLAEKPSCRSAAERNLKECEVLEERAKQRCVELQDVRMKSVCEDHTDMDSLTHSCAALIQQCVCVRGSLQQMLVQWAAYATGLETVTRHTLEITHTLQLCSCPPLSLTTLQANTDRLQLSEKACEEIDQKWAELEQTGSALVGVVNADTAHSLAERLKMEKTQWCEVKRRLSADVRRSVCVMEAWRRYVCVSEPCATRLQLYRDQLSSLTHHHLTTQHTPPDLTDHIHTTQTLQENLDHLQDDLQEEIEATKALIGQLDPSSAAFIQSQSRLLSRGVLQLTQALSVKRGELQEDLKQLQEFDGLFSTLEKHLDDWQRTENISEPQLTDVAESGLLDLSALSPDLDWLNDLSYTRPLSESTNQRLQNLNRKWAAASARALERCSELQAECLQQQGFEQRCESWMSFLQRMEDNLAVELPLNYTHLREQLHTHQRFQAELSLGHQILHSVIHEALRLLERGEVEDRTDFLLKLAQLREHWGGAVQRCAQRRALVDGLVQHWHLYTHGLRKLHKLLPLRHMLLPPTGPSHCSVAQLRLALQNLKRMEQLFQRFQSSYLQTLEVGRQLFCVCDAQTQTRLQTELSALQEPWEQAHGMLGKRRSLTADIIKSWESCETQLADSAQELEDMKVRLKQPMPEHLDEMQEAEQFVKEVEDSLGQWALRLGQLSSMKTDLSQYIITDDVLLLQEQVDHLHGQWEELCLKVSLRKQEIADRLNAWIIFNEKNKELCEWLTQMENKVAHSAELSIEDMVEKLKKDCMEEINLFSENKTHLKQLGEQLISASNKTKEADINDKLKDINDRWQHLFDHIESRVRKLKETLVTVQQLDKNMSNLRTWLSRIEAELAKPVVYSVCHNDEIQRKLAEQQDLQRDIEQHTEGVASVLTLCDVLLQDADACGTDLENDSIKQTTHSLDRRWRNICAMSMERRMRIEETWRLWCKFLDDYSRFEDWLRAAERTAANPATTDTLYTSAKEELKKFEAFQRQVHERLTQLELVNKQYRRLARENRTDAASKLKVMVHEGNQRWDSLQRRVTAVLRRLKYFTSQREEFEGTRESILVWLTEMDLQLTNVEHFSESDIHDKMRQLNAFQQEITLNTNKIDALIVFGETLIQRSAPLDAVLIEDELEELHSYCQEVFGRVARFHQRLTTRRPVLEEEAEGSDQDSELEEGELGGELGGSWDEKDEDESQPGEGEGPILAAARQVCHHLLAPPLEQSGRETPVSVDSIPLEWDHTVDVGGASSHEEEEEEGTYYSALSEVEVTESSEAFQRATARALGTRPVGKAEVTWHHSPDPHQRKRHPHTHPHTHSHTHSHTHAIHSLGSSPTHTSTPFHTPGYVRLMSECSGTIDRVKRVELLLSDEELMEPGLKAVSSPEKQPGVIERWELQQARGASCEHQQGAPEQWGLLQQQLSSLGTWLSATLPLLQTSSSLQPHTSLALMEAHIRKLKEMQKTFTSYKAQMISINLIGRELLGGRDLQSTASDELKELHENLRLTNQKWAQACAALDRWESRLHKALMQCQEFHESLHSMLLWLAQVEKRRFNINIHDHTLHRGALEAHQHTLKSVEAALRARQQEVRPLVAVCGELLLQAEGEESVEAREKLHVVSNKLRLLLRHTQHDLTVLHTRLEACTLGSSVDPQEEQAGGASPQSKAVEGQSALDRGLSASTSEKASCWSSRPLLQRVLRAALPVHLLFLLLLVLTCLVPLSQDDYSCALTNNFARSFYPMLRYTNGPPPT